MTKEFFISREKGGERAVLVQMRVYQAEHFHHFEEGLREFEELVQSAQGDIADVIVGKLTAPHPKYFVGEGKAHEIADAVKTHNAHVAIFNHILYPAQARNCEALFGCRVLDRAELILDIFAQRART